MHAYTPDGWDNFFVTVTGAAAALCGLIFVALSINLTRILASPALAARAREVIIVLFGAIVGGLFGLVPRQPEALLAWEFIGLGGFVWLSSVRTHVQTVRKHLVYTWPTFVLQFLMGQLSSLPFLLAGIGILTHTGPGLYWLVIGFVACFMHALIHAWVLLVEILR